MSRNQTAPNIKVGIVANEFFDKNLGRVGGFGWAAQRAAYVFENHPKCNAKPFFITSKDIGVESFSNLNVNGIPLISLNGNRLKNMLRMLSVKIDILLTIDYRSTYRGVFNALPFTPIVTWVRDPRPQDAIDKMMSLRIPGKEHIIPAGIHANRTYELSKFGKRPFPLRNSVILANKMPHTKKTNHEVYQLPTSGFVLPNPSVVDYSSVFVQKANKPTVIFIGRLDPIKRPWLYIELAKKFPDVKFLMLGKNHFNGEDSWEMGEIPGNVKLLGHVTGDEKLELLSSAWVLVNTSIHEESPVSVMEALAYETPVISYEDWGRLVDRHGIAIGQHLGTGSEGMPHLTEALELLLSNDELRIGFGKAGREYVEKKHNDATFLSSFRDVCLASGIKKAANAITV